ncbi:DNA/RNA non-specific endonuclease [Pycnococcus provasolii]
MRNGGEQLDVKTLLKMQEAVCKVKCLGGGAGSGSLCQVKDWLCILTNNHVLGTPSAAKNASAEFEDRNGNTVTVQLNPDIFFLTNGSLDFTFVGLREKCVKCAGSARSLQPLVLSRGKVSCGDAVHIVQFPRGGEKKFAIQAVKDTSGNKVWYLADTDYGSSGSPVFKAGEVVALHRARDPLRKANEGVLMSAILERLGEHLSQHVKEQQTQFAKSDSPRQQIVDLTMDTSSTGGALRPSSPLIPPETPPRTQQTTTSNSSRGALRSPSPTPPSRQTTTDNSAHGGALRATWLRDIAWRE